ncbi:unnamed protein product [Merluccius merluccius]
MLEPLAENRAGGAAGGAEGRLTLGQIGTKTPPTNCTTSSTEDVAGAKPVLLENMFKRKLHLSLVCVHNIKNRDDHSIRVSADMSDSTVISRSILNSILQIRSDGSVRSAPAPLPLGCVRLSCVFGRGRCGADVLGHVFLCCDLQQL